MLYDFKDDDTSDYLADLHNPKIFAVKRANTWMSFNFAVDAVNEFGKNRGFEKILELLKKANTEESKKLSMLHLQNLTDFMAKTVSLWHRQFATMFVPLVCDLLHAVLAMSESKENQAVLS